MAVSMFAFYGRVSTEDQQDRASSRTWQLTRSQSLIQPHEGQIVQEFFDIGLSRSLPWKRRPAASALLEAFKRPDRGFTAVVIGEPARAFYGNHDLVMSLYGGMSKGSAPASRSGSARQWPPRRRPRAASWVDDPPTATGSWMLARIPTRPKLPRVSASIDWNLIRAPHQSCDASSPNTWPARGYTPLPRGLPATASCVLPPPIPAATATAPGSPGPRARSAPSGLPALHEQRVGHHRQQRPGCERPHRARR